MTELQGGFETDARRWAAVLGRDARAEGEFLYAVRTTGVYCRPTCQSRMPRRENVAFFESAREAERAGFRACKRCGPEKAAPEVPHAEAVARACRRIESATKAPTLEELAEEAGLSPFHFQRVFKRSVGVTPKQYAAAKREQRLRAQLRPGAAVTDAIYDVGYGSGSRAYEAAR